MKKLIILLLTLTSLTIYGQEMSYICGSGSKVLTASVSGAIGTVTYSWSGPGGTTSGANRTVTVAGTYTWTATDENGCTATGTHQILIEADPTASITINANNTCLNTSQTVSATGIPAGYNATWTYGTGSSPATASGNSNSVVYTTTGTKTITLTITRQLAGTVNGCSATCTWTKTKTISVGSLTGQSTCG